MGEPWRKTSRPSNSERAHPNGQVPEPSPSSPPTPWLSIKGGWLAGLRDVQVVATRTLGRGEAGEEVWPGLLAAFSRGGEGRRPLGHPHSAPRHMGRGTAACELALPMSRARMPPFCISSPGICLASRETCPLTLSWKSQCCWDKCTEVVCS